MTGRPRKPEAMGPFIELTGRGWLSAVLAQEQ